MKLSFSTKGWHDKSFDDFCEMASELRFSGIELHNVRNRLFTDKDSAFKEYATAATLRKLYEKKLSIPCIDSICDPADAKTHQESLAELRECLRKPHERRTGSRRLSADECGGPRQAGSARRRGAGAGRGGSAHLPGFAGVQGGVP